MTSIGVVVGLVITVAFLVVAAIVLVKGGYNLFSSFHPNASAVVDTSKVAPAILMSKFFRNNS